jgi:OOP family OmpA-OmpF porin
MKFAKKHLLIASVLASLGVNAGVALAQDVVISSQDSVPYVIDQRNVVARSGTGLCWRTGYWTPAAAASVKAGRFAVGCACDSDLVAKEACEEPKPAPAPAPAPVIKQVELPPPPPPAPAPVAPVVPVVTKVTLAADALFQFNKADLQPKGKAKLDELADKSKQVKLESITISGHTDRIGSDAYNQKLSEKRAATVKEYLVSKGIASSIIFTEGKGKTRPVSGDKCKNLGKDSGANKKLVECLGVDRRIELELAATSK